MGIIGVNFSCCMQADLVRMVGNRLTLLLDDDIDSVEAASGTLREMLPGLNVDLFVSDYPLVLDTDVLATAIEVRTQGSRTCYLLGRSVRAEHIQVLATAVEVCTIQSLGHTCRTPCMHAGAAVCKPLCA